MTSITPFLWFDREAEEAVAFYTSVFDDAEVLDVVRRPSSAPGPEGTVLTVRFRLGTQEFVALNGGEVPFQFNEAVSFVISAADQEEVDYFWQRLAEGGEEGRCGWLKDRYGLSWQVVPAGLPDLLGDPDPERAARATAAMLTMGRLDLGAIERAMEAD